MTYTKIICIVYPETEGKTTNKKSVKMIKNESLKDSDTNYLTKTNLIPFTPGEIVSWNAPVKNGKIKMEGVVLNALHYDQYKVALILDKAPPRRGFHLGASFVCTNNCIPSGR